MAHPPSRSSDVTHLQQALANGLTTCEAWVEQSLALALNVPESGLSVRKGSVWWLRSRQRDGLAQTVLMCVQSPEFL